MGICIMLGLSCFVSMVVLFGLVNLISIECFGLCGRYNFELLKVRKKFIVSVLFSILI